MAALLKPGLMVGDRAVAIVGEPLCQASSQTGGALKQRQLSLSSQ
jgi:hypothetical protein